MRTIVTLLVLAAVVVVGGMFYVHSGLYDVAANNGSRGFVDQIAHQMADSSVEHHAAGIQAPPLGDPAQMKVGADHYQEMCVTCHGAPGIKMSEIGAGLNPSPPNLIRSTRHMSPAEVYWVVKNGIRMTGMPAFGPTHDESTLWAITAFVKQLPTMTPQQYQALAPAHEEGEEHEHEHGEHPGAVPRNTEPAPKPDH
jgi:mono/diheme cytochrome c family protein